MISNPSAKLETMFNIDFMLIRIEAEKDCEYLGA